MFSGRWRRVRAACRVRPPETRVCANGPVAPNVSTTLRLRARRSDCEHAGRKREYQRAAIVSKREQKSPMMASTAADEGKPLQVALGAEPRVRCERRS